MSTYIYALCDIETLAVAYVGATETPQERERSHRQGGDQSSGPWVRQMKRDGKPVGFMILEVVRSRKNAKAAEEKWIKYFEQRAPLMNRKGLKDDLYFEKSVRSMATVVGRSEWKNVYNLAHHLGQSFTTLYRAHRGLIEMPMDLALSIQEATRSDTFPGGFEATKENWPRLVDASNDKLFSCASC